MFQRHKVAANLFHHAIELVLKYRLLEVHSQTVVRYRFGHNLKRLWKAFKKVVRNPSLGRLDPVINDLHKWEQIRYTWFPRGQSLRMQTSLHDTAATLRSSAAQQGDDVFYLSLPDMDDLFHDLFMAASLNPAWLRSSRLMHGDNLAIYERDNLHRLW
jgi:hypothetical protein